MTDLKAAVEAMKKDCVVMGDEVKFSKAKWLRLLALLEESK